MRPDRQGKVTTALAFIILAVGFVLVITPRVMQVQKLRERSEILEKDLMRLKKENAVLEHELKLLKEDPVYLEKVARAQFNKAKEGEIVYKVVRDGQKQPA